MALDLKKVASKAVHDPLGAAGDIIGGALGIGQGADKRTYARRQAAQIRLVKMAQQGDKLALAVLGAIGQVRPLKSAVTDTAYTWRGATLPAGWTSAGWGQKGYKNIIDRARSWYNTLSGRGNSTTQGSGEWDGTTGTAPDAGSGSAPGMTPERPGSAPSAPKEPRPCKYGLRVPDGMGGTRCPKKSEVTPTSSGSSSGLTGSGKKPCKYGDRDADGHCPKKPRAPFTKKQSRQITQLTNRAASAASKIVEAGLKGAGKAISAGLSAAGVTAGAAAATVAAVGGAALLGWFIGDGIRQHYEDIDPAALKAQAAVRANHARRALAERLGVWDPNAPGVGLSRDQQAGIKANYQAAVAQIDKFGSDRAYHKRLFDAQAKGLPLPLN